MTIHRHKNTMPRDYASVLDRYETAVRLRAKGLTYGEVAREMGYVNALSAFRLLTKSKPALEADNTQLRDAQRKRYEQAHELQQNGATLAEIASAIGYKSPNGVHNLLTRSPDHRQAVAVRRYRLERKRIRDAVRRFIRAGRPR